MSDNAGRTTIDQDRADLHQLGYAQELRRKMGWFEPGTWNLKGYEKLVGWTSIAWIAFITILFFAPLFWPFWPPFGSTDFGGGVIVYHQNNFNFTGPLIILSFLGIWAYLQFSGRKWFSGPKVQGTPEELRAIERELDALEHGLAPATVSGGAVD